MKIVLLFILCFNIRFAYSQSFTQLKQGDLGISQARARLIAVEEICPQTKDTSSCMAFGTKITLEITLNGCKDNFGGYFTNFELIDDKGIIHVGAINIANEASINTRCVRMPTKKVALIVPFFGDIEVINVNYNALTTL